MKIPKAKNRNLFIKENAAAVRAAEAHAAKMVTNISETTRKGLKALIVRAMETGRSPMESAREISNMIGMNERQALSAENYRNDLEERDLPLERIEKLMDKYVAKKITERSENIARYETMSALNGGLMDSWKQAQESGLMGRDAMKSLVITDDTRTCPVCIEISDREPIPLNEPFESDFGSSMMPPIHGSCRCTVAVDPGSMSNADVDPENEYTDSEDS